MPLGFGLIGLGQHGARYARHLLKDVSNARLVAVCRKNRRLGSDFARKYGLKYYPDYRDLIADPEVQALAVVTTPNLNEEICRSAAQAEKHILLEKPMARNVAEAARIKEEADKAGIMLMMGHTLRFNSVIQELKRRKKDIGPLHTISINQRAEAFNLPWQDNHAVAGGGAILHMGIHMFDLIRHLSGDEVERVYCETARVCNKYLEDHFIVALHLKSGVKVVADCGRYTAGRSGQVCLVGERGQLQGDHILHSLELLVRREAVLLPLPPPAHTVREALRAFVGAILSHHEPPITAADGLAAMQISEACYRSADTGMPVTI